MGFKLGLTEFKASAMTAEPATNKAQATEP